MSGRYDHADGLLSLPPAAVPGLPSGRLMIPAAVGPRRCALSPSLAAPTS
ncbi:hypothetical protein ACFCX4_05380 [Kitasatospora sp. NPDC056327]